MSIIVIINFTVAFALLSAGLFFIACELVGAPTARAIRASQTILYRRGQQEKSTFNSWVDKLALPLSGAFPLPKGIAEKLERTLYSANDPTPATLYLARCVVRAALLFAVAAMAALVYRPMILAAIAMPILVLYTEITKADKNTAKYREAIERELPELCATISRELRASRDVIRILREYLTTCGKELRHELEITSADMESGNYETALLRLQSRVNSPALNDTVRGLIGVVRGNDEAAYFQMLTISLKQTEIARMKKTAQKAIPRLNAASMVLLVCIMGVVTGILLLDMVAGMGGIF